MANAIFESFPIPKEMRDKIIKELSLQWEGRVNTLPYNFGGWYTERKGGLSLDLVYLNDNP